MCMYECMYDCTPAFLHVSAFAGACLHVYTFGYLHVCIYASMHVCMHTSMYVCCFGCMCVVLSFVMLCNAIECYVDVGI